MFGAKGLARCEMFTSTTRDDICTRPVADVMVCAVRVSGALAKVAIFSDYIRVSWRMCSAAWGQLEGTANPPVHHINTDRENIFRSLRVLTIIVN